MKNCDCWYYLLLTLIQGIPCPPNCADQVLVALLFEGFAQADYVDIDGSVIDVFVDTPDPIEQAVTGPNAFGAFHKGGE